MNYSATAVLNFQEFIDVDGDKQTTDSIKVARVHSKRHGNVLQSIQGLFEQEESRNFTKLNFQLSEYYDSTGRKLPMYLMTKNGYTMLAMGFTGKKAMKFKVAYIGAFNAMAACASLPCSPVKNQRISLASILKPANISTQTGETALVPDDQGWLR
jgi:Rha family phage regulatory protein